MRLPQLEGPVCSWVGKFPILGDPQGLWAAEFMGVRSGSGVHMGVRDWYGV
jgi:hypothetical protein